MFKKLLAMILALFTVATLSFANPALAGDAASGAKIFSANCAACHAGGKNVINPTKTLSKADLKTNSMDSLDAIMAQVTKGKPPMPAFGGKLTAEQIEDVATYVLSQADGGW